MTDHNSKPMNKEELEKYIEKDFLPSLLSKLPIMSKHDNDTCPHLVRASLLEAENARLKAEVERLRKVVKIADGAVDCVIQVYDYGFGKIDTEYVSWLKRSYYAAKDGKPSV